MQWDRVERLLGARAMQTLSQKRIAIIGLGSGGGFVAQGLAMSGVQDFVLMDDDVLKPPNVVRHVADRRDVGRKKVEVMRDLILARNTNAKIQATDGRIADHAHILDDVDLVISAVDGEGSKYQINEYCLAKGKTAIYAGVYERGIGGDVVLVQPDAGPCYACWAANLREGYISPSPDGSGELDYGMVNEQGTLDAEPGLWLHVVRVASVQADFALNELLRGTEAYRELPANTVILANEGIEIIEGGTTPPYGAEWVQIVRDLHCLVCGEIKSQQAHSALSIDALAQDLLMDEDVEKDIKHDRSTD